MLAQLSTWLGKQLGRAEGERITGPLAPVSSPELGFIPMSWPWNFWQLGYDVLSAPPCSIVDACVWAYVRAIAQLPGYHQREGKDGGFEIITTSALSRVLRFPNSYQTRSDFLTHGVRSLLYDGNWYSLAIRNARQEVAELHWLSPRVCKVIDVKVEGQDQHEIFYAVGGDGNPLLNWEDLAIDSDRRFVVPARDVLHVKLATPRHPLIGESWLASLAWDLMNRGAMNASMQTFFNNASRPSGVITTDMELTAQQIQMLSERWIAKSSGLNAGGVPVLSHGLKWQPMGTSQKDSQIVDALKLSDAQVCGVFGVPGMLVGINTGQTFNTTEALMNYWLSNGLGYLLDHIEVQIDQFFGLPANEWTEYDTEALLRTELQARIEALARGVQGGIYAPNEARAKEGYRAVKAGDEPRVQQQVVPLSFALEPPKPAAGTAVPPAPPAAGDQKPEDDEAEGRSVPEIRRMIRRGSQRLAA